MIFRHGPCADLLVHEACRATALDSAIRGTGFEKIFSYHADTVPLARWPKRPGVRHTVLARLIPPPGTEQAEEFEQDLRSGGYTGGSPSEAISSTSGSPPASDGRAAVRHSATVRSMPENSSADLTLDTAMAHLDACWMKVAAARTVVSVRREARGPTSEWLMIAQWPPSG
jgi:hypothetical protein